MLPRNLKAPCSVRRVALAATVLLIATQGARAQSSGDAAADPLPVKAVTLFSSGVSYTLREGTVTGDATVPLTFRTTQINDLLKSMVLIDENGKVQPAVYSAKDPIGRTLQSFAVDMSQPTDQASLLNRLKGARVTVDVGGIVIGPSTVTEKRTIEGQIVGVETETEAVSFGGGAKTVPVSLLSVLGDAGLQSVRLDEVRAIRFEDARINHDFRAALSLLSASADDSRRQVTLHFDGLGKRAVRVGYVGEAPLWKISYRLLIGGASGKDDKPYLQGWALVENTTDEDWNKVRLSLVSGRPISFIQDLYQPLYLPRPVVPPDVVASPYPQLSESNVEWDKDTNQLNTVVGGNMPVYQPSNLVAAHATGMRENDRVKISGDVNLYGRGNNSGSQRQFVGAAGFLATKNASTDDAKSSVTAQATGGKAGELFQYTIDAPVTLPRQQAAMIPVVAQDIAGEKVSIYNADTDPRFPLNAFRIRNNTALHLKGGPITVFDGGVYAGDARMEDIEPHEARLVTYAVDLAVEGERRPTRYSGQETSLSLKKGVLIIQRKERRETTYTLHNKAEQPRDVLVEHPLDAQYKLVQPPTAAARTATHYRFEVLVAAGKTEKLTVATERLDSQDIALIDTDLPALLVYVGRRDVSDAVKAALREVVQRRQHVQDLQNQASASEAEITKIGTDQDRIRKNMGELDHSSALYKRYVAQLDAQETRIEALRAEAGRQHDAAADADRNLKTYIDTLDIAP